MQNDQATFAKLEAEQLLGGTYFQDQDQLPSETHRARRGSCKGSARRPSDL